MSGLPDGYIWLNEHEDSSAAECGCTLYRHHKDSRDPAIVLCSMHEAAPDLTESLWECAGALRRAACQFFACNGYEQDPEDTITCARCRALHNAYKALEDINND